MAKFKFRLSTLLRIRESTRDERRAELAQARSLLKQALRRWRMYAEVYAAGDFETERTAEGDMYRRARAFVDATR